jgi:hypothetical protein
LVHELTYFDKNETKGEKCYSENEVGVAEEFFYTIFGHALSSLVYDGTLDLG